MEFTFTLDGIDAAAARILEANPRRVLLLEGEMGAGKTTLIKAIAARLGAGGMTSSPTFSLVNEYSVADGQPLFHFDFYRLKKPDEAYDMGVEEYFYSGHWCLIEWPSQVSDLIPQAHSRLDISVLPDGTRRVSLVL